MSHACAPPNEVLCVSPAPPPDGADMAPRFHVNPVYNPQSSRASSSGPCSTRGLPSPASPGHDAERLAGGGAVPAAAAGAHPGSKQPAGHPAAVASRCSHPGCAASAGDGPCGRRHLAAQGSVKQVPAPVAEQLEQPGLFTGLDPERVASWGLPELELLAEADLLEVESQGGTRVAATRSTSDSSAPLLPLPPTDGASGPPGDGAGVGGCNTSAVGVRPALEESPGLPVGDADAGKPASGSCRADAQPVDASTCAAELRPAAVADACVDRAAAGRSSHGSTSMCSSVSSAARPRPVDDGAAADVGGMGAREMRCDDGDAAGSEASGVAVRSASVQGGCGADAARERRRQTVVAGVCSRRDLESPCQGSSACSASEASAASGSEVPAWREGPVAACRRCGAVSVKAPPALGAVGSTQGSSGCDPSTFRSMASSELDSNERPPAGGPEVHAAVLGLAEGPAVPEPGVARADVVRVDVGVGELLPGILGWFTDYPVDASVGEVHTRVHRRFRQVMQLRRDMLACISRRKEAKPNSGLAELPAVFDEVAAEAGIRGKYRLSMGVMQQRRLLIQRFLETALEQFPFLTLQAPVLRFLGLMDAELPHALVERVQLLEAAAESATGGGRGQGLGRAKWWALYPRTPALKDGLLLEVSESHLVPGRTPWGHYTEYHVTMQVRAQAGSDGSRPRRLTRVVRRRFRDFLQLKERLEAKLETEAPDADGSLKLPAVWQELDAARQTRGAARLEPAVVSSRRVLLQRCLRSLLLEAPHLLLDSLTMCFLQLEPERVPRVLKARAWTQAVRCWNEPEPHLRWWLHAPVVRVGHACEGLAGPRLSSRSSDA